VKPAVILFSHGSLLCGAGEQLEAHAERLRETGEYSLVEIGYLNYSSPSFVEAVEKCAAAGAKRVLIAPYFLVPGYFVETGLPKVLAPAKQRFPAIEFQVAPVLGDHPLLAQAVVHCARRAATSENWRAILHSAPQFCESDAECPLFAKCRNENFEIHQPATAAIQNSKFKIQNSALLLMIHGSPNPESNAEIFRVAERIRATSEYAAVAIGFMECNAPSIPDAIKNLVASGTQTIVAMPYFLHAGKHVADDLPALLEHARQEYSGVEFLLGDYLGNEPLVANVLRARLNQVSG
jgi:sirohydrochlorin cobaltochelatase